MPDRTDSDIDVEGSAGATVAGRDVHGVPPEQHERMLNTALADLRRDLEDKHAEARRADKAERETLTLQTRVLNGKIAELERRLANPEQAYKEYTSRIAELEKLLGDATVDIGENRIRDAQAAMAAGDSSKAEAIFDEVLAHEARAVQRAAEAAYGKGLIAEEDVRWADAARFFAHAARLDPGFDALAKASEFASRSGNYPMALRLGEDLVALTAPGDDPRQRATALNEHALTLTDTGRYGEAEPLFRQALQIGEQTLGVEHPDYATRLNNLAFLYYHMQRFAEAEGLMQQALAILEAALGEAHPRTQSSKQSLADIRAKLP